MLETWVPPVVALAYALVLFGVAWLGDSRPIAGRYVPAPLVYSLALGVYCTSWTFFGAVGRAASDGWDFVAIYLGPIIVFALLTRVPARMIAVSKEQSITSIADFVASRYGKAQGLAVLASVIALMAVLPYIALQLKAVAGSYACTWCRGSPTTPLWSSRHCWRCSASCSAPGAPIRRKATGAWSWPSPSSRR